MLFANNCNTTLSSSLTNVATTMSVTSATGFPVPTGSQYFYCTLADAATQTTIEIVKVTAVSGTTFTIVRGQDGTTGTIFASGAVVSLRLVAASLNDFPKLDENNTFTVDQYITGKLGIGTTSPSSYATLAVTNGSASNGIIAGFFPNTTTINRGVAIGTDASGNPSISGWIPSTLAYTDLHINPTGGGTLWLGSGQNSVSTLFTNYGWGGLFQRWDTGIPGRTNWGLSREYVAGGDMGFLRSSVANGTPDTTVLYLTGAGGVSIGNTTDPGAGNILVQNNILLTNSALSYAPPSGVQLLNLTGNTTGVVTIGHASGVAAGSYYSSFGYNGSVIGSITQNGTTTVLYNVTSDYRLKSNVTPIKNALATVQSLNPVSFTWIDGRKDDGFIAHELQAIIPNCVTGEKDAVNEDGTPKYQQMDNSGVIPFLVKAIQELTEQFNAYKASHP